MKIKLCFYGENGELEYGGSKELKNISQKKPESFKSHYQKGLNIEKLINLALDYKLIDRDDFSEQDLNFYKLLSLKKLKKIKRSYIGFHTLEMDTSRKFLSCI